MCRTQFPSKAFAGLCLGSNGKETLETRENGRAAYFPELLLSGFGKTETYTWQKKQESNELLESAHIALKPQYGTEILSQTFLRLVCIFGPIT